MENKDEENQNCKDGLFWLGLDPRVQGEVDLTWASEGAE